MLNISAEDAVAALRGRNARIVAAMALQVTIAAKIVAVAPIQKTT